MNMTSITGTLGAFTESIGGNFTSKSVIERSQMNREKAKNVNNADIAGVKMALDALQETISEMLPGKDANVVLGAGFESLVLNPVSREKVKQAFMKPLTESIEEVRIEKERASSLEAKSLFDSKINILEESLEYLDESLESKFDMFQESIGMGNFAPFMQLILPYVMMFSIRNNAKEVISFQQTKEPISVFQKKRWYVDIEGVRHNILDVTKNKTLALKLRKQGNADINIALALTAGRGKCNVLNDAGIAGVSTDTHVNTLTVSVKSVEYNGKSVLLADPIQVGVNNRGSSSKTNVIEGTDVRISVDFDTMSKDFVVTCSDALLTKVNVESAVSIEGYRTVAPTPYSMLTDETLTIDKMQMFEIPQDFITNKNILALSNTDVVVETAAIIKTLGKAIEDIDAFNEVDELKDRLTTFALGSGIAAADVANGKVTFKPDTETGFIQRSHSDTPPSNFHVQSTGEWRQNNIGTLLAEIVVEMGTIFNAQDGIQGIAYASPTANLKVGNQKVIIKRGEVFGGIKVDYGITTLVTGALETKLVTTERADDEEIRVVPRSTSKNQPAMALFKYMEGMTNDIKSAKNTLIPNVSYYSLYGTATFTDVLGNLRLND